MPQILPNLRLRVVFMLLLTIAFMQNHLFLYLKNDAQIMMHLSGFSISLDAPVSQLRRHQQQRNQEQRNLLNTDDGSGERRGGADQQSLPEHFAASDDTSKTLNPYRVDCMEVVEKRMGEWLNRVSFSPLWLRCCEPESSRETCADNELPFYFSSRGSSLSAPRQIHRFGSRFIVPMMTQFLLFWSDTVVLNVICTAASWRPWISILPPPPWYSTLGPTWVYTRWVRQPRGIRRTPLNHCCAIGHLCAILPWQILDSRIGCICTK